MLVGCPVAESRIPAAPGAYVVLFQAVRPVAFRAGALGALELPPGWLMYVGSARGPGGLAARVGRHLCGTGRPRWHVDFLVRALPHLFHVRRLPRFGRFRDRLSALLPADPAPRRIPAIAPPAQALENLKNLGPASAGWLREAGIHTPEQLARAGPVEAFRNVQQTGRRPSVNLLYAVAGALANCRWDRLPEGARGALLLELDAREAAVVEGPWEKR